MITEKILQVPSARFGLHVLFKTDSIFLVVPGSASWFPIGKLILRERGRRFATGGGKLMQLILVCW